MKVYPIVMTQTTATVSKPIKGFFLFLLLFVAYLSGCYLFFKMPHFLYMPMLVNLKILCSDSHNFLTLSWRGPFSYRNQFIDLHSKLMDWFLYDDGLKELKEIKKRSTQENLLRLIKNFQKYFMLHKHMPQIFYGRCKNPPLHPPPSCILTVRSLIQLSNEKRQCQFGDLPT